eukprot:403361230
MESSQFQYTRTHFKEEDFILHGLHSNGVYEIKFHNLKKRNASTGATTKRLIQIFQSMNQNDAVKVIVMHGGSYFSSGNDISVFATAFTGGNMEKGLSEAKEGATVSMVACLTAIIDLEKPLICLVSGGAHGIGCTITGLSDFIYCTPDAVFKTPFMSSYQSPEGGSTITFPQQLGRRLAAEVLLTDRPLTAVEALKVGYINGIVDQSVLIDNAMFYDLNKIPIISRLLQNDLKTMMNAKKLLNIGMNRGHMVECFKREGEALFDIWKSPEFLPNMMKFIHNNSQKKKKISNEQPKL